MKEFWTSFSLKKKEQNKMVKKDLIVFFLLNLFYGSQLKLSEKVSLLNTSIFLGILVQKCQQRVTFIPAKKEKEVGRKTPLSFVTCYYCIHSQQFSLF